MQDSIRDIDIKNRLLDSEREGKDGMEREVGVVSGWGTHVHPWLIHVNVWQNHHSIIK